MPGGKSSAIAGKSAASKKVEPATNGKGDAGNRRRHNFILLRF